LLDCLLGTFEIGFHLRHFAGVRKATQAEQQEEEEEDNDPVTSESSAALLCDNRHGDYSPTRRFAMAM
jgi:hypothetical protein